MREIEKRYVGAFNVNYLSEAEARASFIFEDAGLDEYKTQAFALSWRKIRDELNRIEALVDA